MVQFRALAAFDFRLARTGAARPTRWPCQSGLGRAALLLSDQRPGHQPRHYYALGRTDGADRVVQRRRRAVSRGVHPSEDFGWLRRDDVEDQGEWRRSD